MARRLFGILAAIGISALAGQASALTGSTCDADCPGMTRSEPANPDTLAGGSEVEGANLQLIFYNFYNRTAVLSINGKVVHEGVLNVMDESTGLAAISRVEARGRTIFRLMSGSLDTAVTVDVTPRTRTIMINPFVAPYIEATESDTILLD